jgi:hypothetical protein
VGWVKRLSGHPLICGALAAGEVSESWAKQFAIWDDRLPEEHRTGADKILLTAARERLPFGQIAQLAQEIYERTADPGDDGKDSFAGRYLNLGTTFGGTGKLDGGLSPACTAALQAVLDALGKPAGPEDLRSQGQRNHCSASAAVMPASPRRENAAMAPDWELLADLTPNDLQIALLAEASAILDRQSGPEEDRLLSALPEPVRAIWLLDWLDYEVSQGSLLAYFYNSHGRHAQLAAEVLRRIGANRMADVMAEAAAIHGHAFTAWAARRAELDALGEFAVVKPYAGLPNAHDLVRLTDQYWQAANDDDWGSRLDAYLREQVRLLT